MATYFTPAPRRERTSVPGISIVGERPELDTSSILVFPSPPTAAGSSVPPSPYASSLSSIPTDASFPSDSAYSLSRRTSSRSRGGGNNSRGRSRSHTPSLVSPSWEDLGEVKDETWESWQTLIREPGNSRLQHVGRARAVQPRSRTLSIRSGITGPSLPEPHPPIHFPLMEHIRRIMSIDSETVQLLTRASPAHAELFSVSPYDACITGEDEEAVAARAESAHAHNLRIQREANMLKQGMQAVEDHAATNPFAQHVSIWTLFTAVADIVGSRTSRVLSTRREM